jgi:hypothetical protein
LSLSRSPMLSSSAGREKFSSVRATPRFDFCDKRKTGHQMIRQILGGAAGVSTGGPST